MMLLLSDFNLVTERIETEGDIIKQNSSLAMCLVRMEMYVILTDDLGD